MSTLRLIRGDCIEVMAAMPEHSVDAVVTDPPYGLGFMGKAWDRPDFIARDVPMARSAALDAVNAGASRQGGRQRAGEDYLRRQARDARSFQEWCEAWAREALRVLKPGGHLLAFGGTRTYHRLACAIEDAGFEIRDKIAWLYGSGFPKSVSPYRRLSPCPSIESVPHAVRLSEWLPLESSAAREPTALALVETHPEGDLAVVIRTGRADASPALTVTSLSDFLTADTSLSIESSWSECSAAPWSPASRSTIETATRAITDPRTWKSSALPSTLATITPGGSRPSGCACHVATVASRSSDGAWNLRDTRRLIATERATSPLAALRPLGSALKPAHEPIVVARKALAGTVAANVLEHGTGALNIDGCRIAHRGQDGEWGATQNRPLGYHGGNDHDGFTTEKHPAGRWPANVVLDEEAAVMLDEQTGELHAPGNREPAERNGEGYGGFTGASTRPPDARNDPGGGSRFFYVAKPDSGERNAGLGHAAGLFAPADAPDRNDHPTVKPVDLMRWLARLVTPPGGTVLDPFLGSGTTAIAALLEGFSVVGIEREEAYLRIARARIAHWAPGVEPTEAAA